jgi:hypothetical protein
VALISEGLRSICISRKLEEDLTLFEAHRTIQLLTPWYLLLIHILVFFLYENMKKITFLVKVEASRILSASSRGE